MRHHTALDTGWEFAREHDGPDRVPPTAPPVPSDGWRPIEVPGYWQVQFPELARATGAGWYRLRIAVDSESIESPRLALHFGAVSYFCQGWLNGQYLGESEGGHFGFEWEIGEAAHIGVNELLIRVVSPSGDRRRYPDFPFEETLHGKQTWYGPAGGIWQSVALVASARERIESISVLADSHRSAIDLEIQVVGSDSGGVAIDGTGSDLTVDVVVIGPDGQTVAKRDRTSPNVPLSIDLESVQLWTLETPALYRVEATLTKRGDPIDQVAKTTGFREFGAVDGQFVLNSSPITLVGVLDQDYHDTPGVPRSKVAVLDRFRAIKQMGFNLVRCHIKVPDPMYLDAADEVGLLVWCEPPTTSRLSAGARQRIEDVLFSMIERDRHHPSVAIWSVANEAWGYNLVGSDVDRRWLRSLYHRAKELAHGRLIVDNSPCAPNFHIESDIEDYHFYAVIPELRHKWDAFLEAFTSRTAPTYSPHGDAQRTGTEPLVVSEFGAWGLVDYEPTGEPEPWWFETGQEWADGAAYVHGAPDRAALWHLDRVFGSWAELCAQTQRRQFDTMRYEIETMRRRPEIAGYVLTELGDVHWESNGLFDMWGRPRAFSDRLAELNTAPVVIAIPQELCMWDGATATIDVTAITGDEPRNDVRIEYECLDRVDAVAVGAMAANDRSATTYEVTVRCGHAPELVPITATVYDSSGPIAQTQKELLVIPRSVPQTPASTPLVVADPELGEVLASLGYPVRERGDDPHQDGLRVVRRLDEIERTVVEAGGTTLLLADSTDALGSGFGEFPPISLQPWDDALYAGGSWVSAFSWLRRTGRFAELPGGPLMDGAFEKISPRFVISGIPPARYEYDVLAGVFVGWVHQVAALVARHPVGLGSVLVSTLQMDNASIVREPLPNWILHQLIATALE